MKTQFVSIGLLVAALASATAFADDAQTQMNGQPGQDQTLTTTQTPAQPAQENSGDSSTSGSSDNTAAATPPQSTN